MSAYAIMDLEVHDIEAYLAYQQALRPLLDAAGARYLARGGPFRVLDGDYQPRRLVLMEFPDFDALEDFFEGEPYLALEPRRRACSAARILAVQGLEGDAGAEPA